jgi:opacity protein-like surface antigen
VRQAVALLIITSMGALFLTSGTAKAKPFNGPEAVGATLAAGILTGIACWTVELATEGYDEEVEPRDDDYDRRGWFAGLQGVYAREDYDVDREEKTIQSRTPFPIEFSLKNHDAGGVRGKFGRRCHSRFSVEFEMEWLDDFAGEVVNKRDGTARSDIKFSTIAGTINTKGYLLTGRVQPFVLVGVGAMSVRGDAKDSGSGVKTSQDDGHLVARFGGGIDFYVNRHWVVSGQADYVYSATNLESTNYISVGFGAMYRW